MKVLVILLILVFSLTLFAGSSAPAAEAQAELTDGQRRGRLDQLNRVMNLSFGNVREFYPCI